MSRPARKAHARPRRPRTRWLGAPLALLTCLLLAPVAHSAPGLEVIPHPAGGSALSYFKLSARPGSAVAAGTIELRNLSSRSVRVALAPVAGQTIDTLGSTYAAPGKRESASSPVRWLQLGSSRIALAPGAQRAVPVHVLVPAGATPGDFLAGVSVEALGQEAATTRRRGVSIASVVRYAIGVEVSLPGPRHPLIRFTGARLERQPAGLAFLLDARNAGNVILQGVQGQALITRGRRVVASTPLGPGTFVTGTSIAYPIRAPRERPAEGTVYRVRAYLRYAGGIARLDTTVRFGHAQAVIQQAYGGPRARSSGGLPGWAIALLAAAACGLAGAGAWYLTRVRGAGPAPLRTLQEALAGSRASGQPLSLIVVTAPAGTLPPGDVGRVLRSRLRGSDRLCRLGGGSYVVVARDTDVDTAGVLADDLRRQLERVAGPGMTVHARGVDGDADAHELLAGLQAGGETDPVPAPHL